MDHRATVVLLVLLMALAYVAGDPCVCDGSFGTSPWENKVSQTRAENGKPFIDAKVFPLHNATAKWDMRVRAAYIGTGLSECTACVCSELIRWLHKRGWLEECQHECKR
jgi:hypothetical protein